MQTIVWKEQQATGVAQWFPHVAASAYGLMAAAWVLWSAFVLLTLLPGAADLVQLHVHSGASLALGSGLAFWCLIRAHTRALERQRGYFRTLLEETGDLVVVVDMANCVQFASASVHRSLGHDAHALAGGDLAGLLHEEDLAPVREAIARAFGQPGRVFDARARFLRQGSGHRTYDLHVRAIHDPERRLVTVVSGRDVTERIAANQQISRLAAVVEQAAESVVLTDTQGRILYVNECFQRVTGYSLAEVIGRNPSMLKSGHQDKAFYEDLWGTLASGSVWRGHLVNRRKDGTLFHEDASIFPVRDGGGVLVGFAAVKQDASARIAAEEHIRKLNRLYITLSRTIEVTVQSRSREELFRKITRVAVEAGGYQLAWVGVMDDDGAIRPVEGYGPADGYLRGVELSRDASRPEGRGPTGTAARDGRVAVTAYGPNESEPCRRHAFDHGFRSAASLPLRLAGGVVGTFTLCSGDVDAFGPEEVRLLEEMSADISFALDSLDGEARRRIAEAQLKKLSRAVEQSPNVVFITDRRGVIEYVNPRFSAVTGFSADRAVGRHARFLTARGPSRHDYRAMWSAVREGGEWHGEVSSSRANGQVGWCTLSVAPVRNEHAEVTHYVAVAEDISERKAAQAMVEVLAFYDAVTQLPNRRLFEDRFGQAAAGARRSGKHVAALFMDLDRFKQVNDSLGHAAGDQLLSQVGARLADCVRSGDTVARLGGDEFAVLLSDIPTAREAALVAEKILAAFGEPFRVAEQEVFTATSIGIALYPDDGADYETLVRNADAAMYLAKEVGNTFRFFTPELNRAASRRLELEGALRRGLERGELEVHYQPQVRLATGELTGMEALVRWNRPGEGLVGPCTFIPLAEDTGLIVPIGEHVLREACRQTLDICSRRSQAMRVAVNLSARQFWQGDILDTVRKVLEQTGLAPSSLELEMTESVIMKDPDRTAITLRQLKDLGVTISIDDFGTGYSSLNYLKRFPIDKLKIDRSFVRDIATDPNNAAIVAAVVAMAQRLRMRVVAEGVETAIQRDFLMAYGCTEAQGYYFARPMDRESLGRYLQLPAPIN